MNRYPEGLDTEAFDQVELLEDRTTPIARTTRTGRRMGKALPGAVAGAFLITALAFGANALPASQRSAEDGANPGAVTAENGGGTGDGGTYGQDGGDTDSDPEKPDYDGDGPKETSEPADGGEDVKPVEPGPDGDEPKDEPADEPKDEPEPKPDVRGLELALRMDGAKVVVDWSTCEADHFVAYKVIRSTDEKVTYPRGGDDILVGVVENAGTTAMADAAPSGKKLFYRVFGVVEWEGNPYTIACATGVKGIQTPEAKPEPKPEPKPTPEGLSLKVVIDGGHPWLDWSDCGADGLDYYKVVRSTDSTVKFPPSDNDTVVAAVGPDGKTAFYDKEAPGSRKLWYRVFCVGESEAGYKVLAASDARVIETPAYEKPEIPDPKGMGFEIGIGADGGIVLHWEACGGELFHYYKVVRSRFENPSYLPGTDGSEVIAVIENPANTEWVDGVDEGGTWYYRVQSIGVIDGQKVLLGQTAVKSVPVE